MESVSDTTDVGSSIFESFGVDEDDASLIVDAVALYLLKYGRRNHLTNLRRLLEFWHPRLMEKGVTISKQRINQFAPFAAVMERISEMDWNGSSVWDRDFFEGFLSACATVARHQGSTRAKLLERDRFRRFLLDGDHGQAIRLHSSSKCKFIQTGPLYFMDIKPPGNLEKNLCGVFSGGRLVRNEDGLWMSVRGAAKPVFDRLGIVYEHAKRNTLLVSPFYIKLFNDEMPEQIAPFWREEIGTENHRNAMVVAWMHWELMFGRSKRRLLDGFPYLKSPQGSNRFGLKLDEIRSEMKHHRFDHVDSRIANRLVEWMERQKDEDDGTDYA